MRKRRGRERSPEGSERPSWGLEEGDTVTDDRVALRRLGGSNLYETYLVWDDRLFTIAVAKLVRPHKVGDPKALAAIRREAAALERLNHPLLVRSFDAVLGGPRPHLLLEHLEGPPLRTLIKKYAPLSLEQVLPLAADLCSVLHYMAMEGTVHLDVKPANVIMASAPKLVDLSVAHSLEEAGELGGGIGTPEYMAPEQHEPDRHRVIGPPADIWGLGVTVYEAIAGRRPFPEGDGRIPNLLEPPAPLSEDVPQGVAKVILACLARDPWRRPKATQLALALAPMVEAVGGRRVIRRGRPRWR